MLRSAFFTENQKSVYYPESNYHLQLQKKTCISLHQPPWLMELASQCLWINWLLPLTVLCVWLKLPSINLSLVRFMFNKHNLKFHTSRREASTVPLQPDLKPLPSVQDPFLPEDPRLVCELSTNPIGFIVGLRIESSLCTGIFSPHFGEIWQTYILVIPIYSSKMYHISLLFPACLLLKGPGDLTISSDILILKYRDFSSVPWIL